MKFVLSLARLSLESLRLNLKRNREKNLSDNKIDASREGPFWGRHCGRHLP